MRNIFCLFFLTSIFSVYAQETMTPELLWSLHRVSAISITNDGNSVIYSTTTYDVAGNDRSSQTFRIPLGGGEAIEISDYESLIPDRNLSPDGKYKLSVDEVKVNPVSGSDFYPELENSQVWIYDRLSYRHWDAWEDGKYSHLFVNPVENGSAGDTVDIMAEEPFDCPQQPFGGEEDYTWGPDGNSVYYVAKKYQGVEYALSTNSDIYVYHINDGSTENLTEENKGYDTQPAFSPQGTLAYLQMDEAGYESDKNDLILLQNNRKINLTAEWDGTVSSFLWSNDGSKIYFIAPVDGTIQCFEILVANPVSAVNSIKQITSGAFDIRSIVGESNGYLVVSRSDMNHATELYTLNLSNGAMTQLTHANDSIYDQIQLSRIEKRMIPTTDGKEMLTWVIYPPDFDPSQKYPTLLYCQGGPQSPLSQFYSFRWNFQLMAAQGYIVVAPNRRGMPGHGVVWNEQISGDYGGQNIRDYLSAIDALSEESFVDQERLGCVGASYGGYSVFYLAGIHNNRFKSFIAHDGIFNTRSMYGTTEELFFVNKDLGGPYWEEENEKSYSDFNPLEKVTQWDTPILIIQGGKDYRVPDGQAFEAFQAAQLQGIKSKLIYFPDENHWVLSAQNGIVWQREFFKWLEETLK